MTTDPAIAGLHAQIDELTEQRDRLLRDGTKVMGDLCEVREWHRRDAAERDALAAALIAVGVPVTPERGR